MINNVASFSISLIHQISLIGLPSLAGLKYFMQKQGKGKKRFLCTLWLGSR